MLGMTGSKDPKLLENFDPKTELCAGKIFKLRLQVNIYKEDVQLPNTKEVG